MPPRPARLFTETYGRELEPDVLADVAARTEGWAASLQLVQAALRDRTPAEIRRFVRGLSGADQELYDYLAEEVVGDLPDDLQQFLMRTSILQVVTPDLAGVVTGPRRGRGRAPDRRRRTPDAPDPTRRARHAAAQRYHPLVREFLEARLRSTVGAGGRRRPPPPGRRSRRRSDWRVAAYHYREAGDHDSVASTIAAAIPEIMGSGQHADRRRRNRTRAGRSPDCPYSASSRPGSRCSGATTTSAIELSHASWMRSSLGPRRATTRC